ncbi:MAG: hypothetical protein KDI43_03065 [Gammaproteobacteria bacterium]|nr:hypothetical protein [Gammaproteobacteria bacterium]
MSLKKRPTGRGALPYQANSYGYSHSFRYLGLSPRDPMVSIVNWLLANPFCR